MAEYIDRNKFISDKRKIYCEEHCVRRQDSKGRFIYEIGDAPCRACYVDDMLYDVENYPAADVVEVVRCESCKYYKGYFCEVFEKVVFPDMFCSNGEKGENDA